MTLPTASRLRAGAAAIVLVAAGCGGGAPSSGCGSTRPDPGESTVTITSGGEKRTYLRYIPDGGPSTADVELFVIDGGEHSWPGSVGMGAYEGLLGPVSTEVDASKVIRDFFEAHTVSD